MLCPRRDTLTHVGAQLVQTASGSVQTVLNPSLSSLGPLPAWSPGPTLTVNGTLDQAVQPDAHDCSPGQSQVQVGYSTKTEKFLWSRLN